MSAVLTPTLAGTATPPPRIGTAIAPPQPIRWTIQQYRELYKTGLFNDVKTMLIHGEVFVMGMPGPRHTLGLTRSFRQLDRIFTQGSHVRRQDAFNIGTANDPGPDLAVVPGIPEDYPDSVPTKALLIVEVSESTLLYDTTTKAELYATAGVPDYWVIDLENRQLIVYRDPVPLPAGLGATAYRTHLAIGPNDSVSPLAAPTASVKVADLLP